MRIFLLSLTFTLFIPCFAQEGSVSTGVWGEIIFGIKSDEQKETLTAPQQSKIESKITQLVSNHGINGTSASDCPFVICPKLEFYEERTVEGMQNLYVINGNLHLFIKQSVSNLVFLSYSQRVQGSGTDRNTAVTNLIEQINLADPQLKQFLDNGRQKILDFFNSKCDDILSQSEQYAQIHEYEKALALLTGFPTEASPCQEKIKEKTIAVFRQYQEKKCTTLIQLSNAHIAANDFKAALSILAAIDVTSTCHKEAASLILSIEQKLDQHQRSEWEKQKELLKQKTEIQNLQLTVSKGIVGSFFKNRWPFSLFNFLF